MASSTTDAPPHEIYLIPGFFGFSALGKISYFHHVAEALTTAFDRHDCEVSIYPVGTLPTASIPSRVENLAGSIKEHGDPEATVDLIGHSTGGLDARLLATPGFSVAGVDKAPFQERVGSVVTVSTPHFGTPSASVFDGLFGQKLLYVLSLGTIFTLRFGQLPLKVLFKLVGLLTKLDNQVGLRGTVLDQFHEGLFSQFDPQLRAEIREFLNHIVADRSALGQLTPGSIDLFNAAVNDHPDIDYGCVVTRTPTPAWRHVTASGLNPYKQASYGLFQVLRQIAGRGKLKIPESVMAKRPQLKAGYDSEPDSSDSDGMVPTLSQVWGRVISSISADHLDVCGHFDEPEHEPPHIDWLVSGSQFRRPQFEAVWEDVAEFVLEAE
ncbi:MAG: esterase/lipase family protein [Bradymonadaceae bacterium]